MEDVVCMWGRRRYLYSSTATCDVWRIPNRIVLVRHWPLCTSFDSRRIAALRDTISIDPEERPFSQVTWLQFNKSKYKFDTDNGGWNRSSNRINYFWRRSISLEDSDPRRKVVLWLWPRLSGAGYQTSFDPANHPSRKNIKQNHLLLLQAK